jgi:hypothetical protein
LDCFDFGDVHSDLDVDLLGFDFGGFDFDGSSFDLVRFEATRRLCHARSPEVRIA